MSEQLVEASVSGVLTPLHDRAARERALDTSKSILVQAPAGSGKTELLTDRFLKLLSEVEEPEQVLAITFTRGATAEMRTRVIEKLQGAQEPANQDATNQDAPYRDGSRRESVPLKQQSPAFAALLNSQQRGWQILEHPQRLNIQTIDSLCLSIAHRMPLLARLGGNLHPTENADPLYQLAAQRTLQQLGGADAGLDAALRALLAVRDNNLLECERLLAEMLRQRDQWGHLFLLSDDVEWEDVRARLEKPFQREINRVLIDAHRLLSSDPAAAAELMAMVKHSCENGPLEQDIRILKGFTALPGASAEFLKHWWCLTELLLTGGNKWRRAITAGQGFPAGVPKRRMMELITHLQTIPGLLDTLRAIRRLPPPRYEDAQWELLRYLFATLRHAVAELKVVFAEKNMVDFVELGLAAEMVMRAPEEGPSVDNNIDRALALSDRVRHVLVDEFQDTSRRQHQLLTSLLRGWDNCDGRTCFLVGDPMQSIYLFRQAEVELFGQVSRNGLNCDGTQVEFESLRLQTNFRSHAGLVEPLNEIFTSVFGRSPEAGVEFAPSVAKVSGPPERAVHVHPSILPSAATLEEKQAARERETAEVLSVVRKHWPGVERARQTPRGRFTIGILVRAKKHAVSIAAALRTAGFAFRSVELETLCERQEILDLVALTRALTHPMDRVAWLSVLRAPWCGLALSDLHALCGTDVRHSADTPILQLLETQVDRLSAEGRQRANAARAVLSEALHPRNRFSASLPFASWIERTWYGLGGHRCVDRTAFENVQAFFSMLDDLDRSGTSATPEAIDTQLSRLFAQPDPEAGEHAGIQVMTIHKAKGLGFDVVIVPGLERSTGSDGQSLICWLQRVSSPVSGTASEDELLVAPIGEKGDQTGPLYKWVQRQRAMRETEERKRLLYVACTRAGQELHLLGTATLTKHGLKPGQTGSLLETSWPALQSTFDAIIPGHAVDQATPFTNNVVAFQRSSLRANEAEHSVDLDLAAAAVEDATIRVEASGFPGLRMRRLPLDLAPEAVSDNVTTAVTYSESSIVSNEESAGDRQLFIRPEGSLAARALGTAVHALFERAAFRMEQGETTAQLRATIPALRKQALSLLRNSGIAQGVGIAHGVGMAAGSGAGKGGKTAQAAGVESLADRAIEALALTLDDPIGLWLLSPHKGAQSETSWTGWLDGALRTLRVDRIFYAGTEPLSGGDDCLWIIDYKTASRSASEVGAFLKEERQKYERQLQTYGEILRLARGSLIEVRLALYYPFLRHLEHWSMARAVNK